MNPDCTVAIAGGGPGGAVLAYLLARAGVPVTLLEARPDFERAYRGDSLHPYTLELLDRLGLAEAVLEIPHVKADGVPLPHPARRGTRGELRGSWTPGSTTSRSWHSPG